MNINIKDKNQKIKGFSLIEMILIMFIISFAFTGIYNVLGKVFQHEKDNRYSLIAANLAQEGVEIIRNRRDENLLDGLAMNSFLNNGNCYPYWNGTVASCDGNRRSEVQLDASEIYRNCPNGGCTATETPFIRVCNISGNDEEMVVKCRVEWKSPILKTDRHIEIRSLLTNWQENT